tara:strand:+ start:979 stop:1674 length:696 start_codon:yes stop_codon:yes gene_type:complete
LIGQDKIWAFIQARFNSSRLKGKVLKCLSGRELLKWVIDRTKKISPNLNYAVITGNRKENELIFKYCMGEKIKCFIGSEDNVLNRFLEAANYYHAKTIIRLTADNPLFDFDLTRKLLLLHLEEKADYSSSKSEIGSGLPDGIGSEIFDIKTLENLNSMNLSDSHNEHVNDYILENPAEFNFSKILLQTDKYKKYSFTIDTIEDWKRIENLIMNSDYKDISKSDFWKTTINI